METGSTLDLFVALQGSALPSGALTGGVAVGAAPRWARDPSPEDGSVAPFSAVLLAAAAPPLPVVTSVPGGNSLPQGLPPPTVGLPLALVALVALGSDVASAPPALLAGLPPRGDPPPPAAADAAHPVPAVQPQVDFDSAVPAAGSAPGAGSEQGAVRAATPALDVLASGGIPTPAEARPQAATAAPAVASADAPDARLGPAVSEPGSTSAAPIAVPGSSGPGGARDSSRAPLAADAVEGAQHRVQSSTGAPGPADGAAAVTIAAPSAVDSSGAQGASPASANEVDGTAPPPRFAAAVADRVHWLVDHGGGEARIKLHPPELGALDVRIAVVEDRTYVHFSAGHPAARDLLESALPRLRELLGAAGLELGGATVGGDGARQFVAPARHVAEGVDLAAPAAPRRPLASAAAGRVDLYA